MARTLRPSQGDGEEETLGRGKCSSGRKCKHFGGPRNFIFRPGHAGFATVLMMSFSYNQFCPLLLSKMKRGDNLDPILFSHTVFAWPLFVCSGKPISFFFFLTCQGPVRACCLFTPHPVIYGVCSSLCG